MKIQNRQRKQNWNKRRGSESELELEELSDSERPMTEQELEEELRRAKLRALHLLTAMDRTEADLREKLAASYCEQTMEKTIAYVKSFGYIDDERYVKNYIESRSRNKSRRQIEQELIFKKGLSKEIVAQGFENAQMTEVSEVIEKYMRKKRITADCCDYEQKRKFYAYMLRKGFQMDDLNKVFDLT